MLIFTQSKQEKKNPLKSQHVGGQEIAGVCFLNHSVAVSPTVSLFYHGLYYCQVVLFPTGFEKRFVLKKKSSCKYVTCVLLEDTTLRLQRHFVRSVLLQFLSSG